MPGGLLLLSVALAWRWEAVGGSLLIFEGLSGLVFIRWAFSAPGWQPTVLPFMIATLAGPPLVAGILFVADWWIAHHPPTSQPAELANEGQ